MVKEIHLTASEPWVASPPVMGSSDSHKRNNFLQEIEIIDVMSPGLSPHIWESQMAGYRPISRKE